MKRKPRWLINSALILIPPYWLSTAENSDSELCMDYPPTTTQHPTPSLPPPPKTDTQTHFPKYWGHVVTHATVNAQHWFLGRLRRSAESEVSLLVNVGFPLTRTKPLLQEAGYKYCWQTLTGDNDPSTVVIKIIEVDLMTRRWMICPGFFPFSNVAQYSSLSKKYK